MILNLSSHNIAKLESFLSRICCGARLLKFSSRFTAYSIHPIELKLGSMIADISPHNLAPPIFLDFLQAVAVGARLLSNLQIDSQPTVLMRLS